MIENLLFVCVGNICRSPMAEGLFRKRLGDCEVEVSSAGLGALVDEPAVVEAQKAMSDVGIDISQHRAQQLTEEMLLAADMILVMEKWQKKEIQSAFFFTRGRVHMIGKWSGFEVPDPYKKSQKNFDYCLELLEEGWQDWQHSLIA